MLPGATIELGGEQYVLPPLNLRLYYDFEKERQVIMDPGAHTSQEYTDATAVLIVESLKRNYPEIQREFVLEHISVPDCPKYVLALLSNAGFEARPLDRPKAPATD